MISSSSCLHFVLFSRDRNGGMGLYSFKICFIGIGVSFSSIILASRLPKISSLTFSASYSGSYSLRYSQLFPFLKEITLNQQPQKLNEAFTVEMANGKTETTKDVYVGCTLTLNNHSFQIDLMPVNIRSFDVIIDMDWLSPHHADIMCHEKAVHLQLPNHETLIIYGDKPCANLRLISCIKAQKCIHKKNYAFLAHPSGKRLSGCIFRRPSGNTPRKTG